MPGNGTYALVETEVPDGYKGLESVYAAVVTVENGTATIGTEATNSLETVEINGKTGYILKTPDGENLGTGYYAFNAYNEPEATLTVTKADVDDANNSVVPTANVTVYKVPADVEITDEYVENLVSSKELPEGVTKVESKWTAGSTDKKSLAEFTGLEQGARYLAVETQAKYDGTLSPVYKEDSRVKWYGEETIPEYGRTATVDPCQCSGKYWPGTHQDF